MGDQLGDYEEDWKQRQEMNHPDGIERLEREEALIKLQEIISQTRGVLDNIGPKKIETLLLTGSWALLASGDYGTTVPVHKKSDVDFLSITIEPDICYKEITSIKQRLKEVLAGITGISDPVSIEGWSYSPE